MAKSIFKTITFVLTLTFLVGTFAVFAQAAPNRPSGSGSTSNSSVNHIDISVDLAATVIIDGKAQNAEFTITTADAKYVTVTADPADTDFSISGGVSTSTDNQGNKQIRIEGNFPVGTRNAPIKYTVTLSKTITTSGGYQFPVTLSTTMHYWDSGNVCPGYQLNPGKQSGIDLELGNSTVKGTLAIQKTIVGAELAQDKTFYFTVLDSSGNVSKENVPVTVPAGQTTATVFLTNFDLGTYSIQEVPSSGTLDGYTLTSTTYTNNGKAVITSSLNTAVVNVTSTYFLPRPTTGNLEIVLNVTDAKLKADKIFYFDIYDAGNNLIAEDVQLSVLAGCTSGSVVLDGMAYGSYRIVADTSKAEIEDLLLHTTTYSNNGEIVICENDPNPKVVVTHKYAKPAQNIVTDNYFDIVIPDSIDGEPLTVIQPNAFFGLRRLRTVTIPTSVIEIGDNAFAECPDLMTIVLQGRSSTSGMRLGSNWAGNASVVFTEAPNIEPPEDPDTPSHEDPPEGSEELNSPTTPSDDPTEPTEDPTDPTEPTEKPKEPAEESTTPTTPSDDPTEPTEDPTDPTEPTEKPKEPAEESTTPTTPSGDPTEPIEKPPVQTAPSEQPTEPVDKPTVPTDPESPSEPTGGATEPSAPGEAPDDDSDNPETGAVLWQLPLLLLSSVSLIIGCCFKRCVIKSTSKHGYTKSES